MVARFRTKDGKTVTLSDVRFEEQLVTGTTKRGADSPSDARISSTKCY